jgi:hypothetical protein
VFDDPQIAAALERAARRYGAGVAALRAALEHESADELMQVLGISLVEARARIGRVERVLAFSGDWGAGCKLLTDDVRDELLAVLDSL